jgi:hypothetical protein
MTIAEIKINSSPLLAKIVMSAMPNAVLARWATEKSGSNAIKTAPNISSSDIRSLITSLLEIAARYPTSKIAKDAAKIIDKLAISITAIQLLPPTPIFKTDKSRSTTSDIKATMINRYSATGRKFISSNEIVLEDTGCGANIMLLKMAEPMIKAVKNTGTAHNPEICLSGSDLYVAASATVTIPIAPTKINTSKTKTGWRLNNA